MADNSKITKKQLNAAMTKVKEYADSLGGTGGSTTSVVSPWNGKVASFIGDSITFGVKAEKTYHAYLKELIGFSKVNNYGIDGSSITSHSNGMCERYINVDSTSDIIFVLGGTNDYYQNKSLGEWYEVNGNTRTFNTDITTFRGALNTLCLGLINNFPNKKCKRRK